jgi:hypothetical protein
MAPAFIVLILFIFVVSVYTVAPLYLNSKVKLAGDVWRLAVTLTGRAPL